MPISKELPLDDTAIGIYNQCQYKSKDSVLKQYDAISLLSMERKVPREVFSETGKFGRASNGQQIYKTRGDRKFKG